MPRATSSTAILPAYTFVLLGRYWAPLLCAFSVGYLVHWSLMRGLVRVAGVHQAIGLAGLGLTLLVTLATTIVMFHLVRPSLQLVDSELSNDPVSKSRTTMAQRERRVVDGVVLAILPFLIFYSAWGLIGEEFETYSVGLLNDGGLESFAAPHEVNAVGLPLVIALVAWLMRRVCEFFYRKNKNGVLGVLTALFEAVWMFMVVFSIGVALNRLEAWAKGRVVWAQLQEALSLSFDWAGGLVGLTDVDVYVALLAALASLWAAVKSGLLAPLLWLTIAAVVYRAEIDEDAVLFERRRRSQLGQALSRFSRFSRGFGRAGGQDLMDKYTPFLNAFRFVLTVGPVFYLTFAFYYVLVEVGFSQLHRLVFVIGGPGDFLADWWLWLGPIDFLVGAARELVRVCLLAAAFEIALRKVDEGSSGRRERTAVTHVFSRSARRR
ncbi:hypothetical protein [Nocardiopsis metallicus]|uniref:Uncharacterized protein n=1 Tax=Nocardiopsis metallicus TaxID=179819 RepID=A0A840WEI2_9ACTN|nr:hypothetical protein [Nocardiopsis metallicus]MBB5493823.1 hypothetical protein [Nocardiopsis metallicus]